MVSIDVLKNFSSGTAIFFNGITGKILGWIKNFLTDRKQKVVLNGSNSDWTEVTSGIPQGSVLGPILFTIYINDLPDVVYNMAKLFADDTKLYDEERASLQNDIDRLVQWSRLAVKIQ
jgi:hypothetical protein